ncbi:MAG: RNA 2',3'-cyclic phosphodiesterase [bacterium]|nr:RNA 2',3'-cyclic phosphodiesterase [bacterium]
MRRLFIGLPIEGDESSGMEQVSEMLGEYGGILKAVPRENFHITLKFLGETAPELAESIIEDFSAVSMGLPPVEYRLKGLGYFGKPGRNAVLWTGLESDKTSVRQIERIQQIIEDFSAGYGFKKEKRRFTPHLTIARLKKNKTIPEKLLKDIQESTGTVYYESAFKRVVLYESELTRQGAIYTEQGELLLGKV